MESPDTHKRRFEKWGGNMTEKDSEIYKAMKVRYIEFKVILSASGIDLTELDRIKE